MKYHRPINWNEVPDIITKEQFYRICHISKSTALYLLQSGTVPCEYSGKKLDIRHRIEEKNGEMKIAHGFQRADSMGLVAMQLQAYFTAVVVNMKRIVTVMPG